MKKQKIKVNKRKTTKEVDCNEQRIKEFGAAITDVALVMYKRDNYLADDVFEQLHEAIEVVKEELISSGLSKIKK